MNRSSSMRRQIAADLLALLCLCAAPAAHAQAPGTPVPQDIPWLGPLAVAVDATDLAHHLLRIHETLPVRPGPLTLLFPRWLPGTHGPWGQTQRLAGLVMQADGKPLAWRRDPLDPQTFHVEIPPGATQLAIDFQHLAPPNADSGRLTLSPVIAAVGWENAVLYPAGHFASALRVAPRLRLPAGWQAGTALRGSDGALARPGADAWWTFDTVSLETLIDSPVYAGRHVRRIELDPPGTAHPVALDLFADDAQALDASEAQVDAHRQLVAQADALYGARHFRHYDLLLTLSAEIGDIGLEHHESSENSLGSGYFKDWDKVIRGRGLLPHEYTHSWNGKFRRPADLWTSNYNQPMQDSLLWVYEGQTEYWGTVLTARSGLVTPEQARHLWAKIAAEAAHRPGRQWRALQDTTNEETLAQSRDKDWSSWQRGVDYYDEGALIWLDADTLIRSESGGARSLDDFARRFFGVQDGRVAPLTYTFDDVVATLNAVQPHDWAAFLRQRLDAVGGKPPLEGLARSGWKLVYTETPSPFAGTEWSDDEDRRQDDFAFSLGLRIAAKDAKFTEVLWDSPAFDAGCAPGVTLIAVNGEAYKAARLAAAVTANKAGAQPIELLLRDGERYRSVTIDYRGGLRYPSLARVDGTPDLLGALMAPK